MGKRLFSADKRAETILNHFRDKGENVSAFISSAVVDEMLPVYSQLRIEALYLLDVITDGAKDWRGAKLLIASEYGYIDSKKDIEFITRQTIGRGVSWLRTHHIRNAGILQEIITYFRNNLKQNCVTINDINDSVKSEIYEVITKIKEIDSSYDGTETFLHRIAQDVLDHWDNLWDYDESYDIIVSLIYSEKLNNMVAPLDAIRMLQWMENQYIIEAINEM